MSWAPGRIWRQLAASIADRGGAAATEAAIVTPLLLILVVGTVEFGNMLYNANLIQTGLRDAARYLARVGDPTDWEIQARQLAVTGTTSGEAPSRVAWWNAEDIVVTYRKVANLRDDSGHRPLRGGDEVLVIRVATEIDYGGLGTLRVISRDGVRLAFAHEERFVGD